MTVQLHNTSPKMWRLLLLQGLSAIILGLLLLNQPPSNTEWMVVAGAYWFVGGIFLMVRGFSAGDHWRWTLLMGSLGIVAGLFGLEALIFGETRLFTTLLMVMAIQGILVGIVDLVRGSRGDGMSAYDIGMLNLLIGSLLLAHLLVATPTLSLVLGIFSLIGGAYLVYHALQIHTWEGKSIHQG